jgi:hypothetical protein
MFATLLSIALFALPAIQGVNAEFSIATPKSLTACEPVTFTWDKTKGPYSLYIVQSSQPCGAILADLGDINGTEYNWTKAVLPANMLGQKVSLSLEDANGDEAWSQGVTFSNGTDLSCLVSTTTPGTTTVPANVAATPSVLSTATGAVAVGAANSGSNPFAHSGAPNARQISGSVFGISALVALLALAL